MDILCRKLLFLRSACSRLVKTPSAAEKLFSLNCNGNPDSESPDVEKKKRRLVVESLADREILRVGGEEIIPFLQGLITNDMKHVQGSPESSNIADSMYTLFLNKAGRVLYDSIIYRTQDPSTYLIECDREISNELRRHLRLYRVRRNIKIDSVDKEYRSWVVFNPEGDNDVRFATSRLPHELYTTQDPRVRSLGARIVTTPDINWSDLAKVFASISDNISVEARTHSCNYRQHRYKNGVGEGVQDLPPGKCFPLEANCDFLHGVSFQKGCYIGQELTARVHHTGVIRKRLMPLRLTSSVADITADIQSPAGFSIGVLRGVSSNRALALLRVDQALKSAQLTVEGDVCYAEKPNWWPTEICQKARFRDSA